MHHDDPEKLLGLIEPKLMDEAEVGRREDLGLAIWWSTHDVWVRGKRWFTGDPRHRHRMGAGYVRGLPNGECHDFDRAMADEAEAKIALALRAGTVERGEAPPPRWHPQVWSDRFLRSVMEVFRG